MNEWRCFHCGEVFTTVRAAREHFGYHPTAPPACRPAQEVLQRLRWLELAVGSLADARFHAAPRLMQPQGDPL